MSQLFASGGQSIGASASASIVPMNIQDLFPLRLTCFNLLGVQGTLKSLLQHHSSKASILWHPGFFMVQLSHSYMTIVGKVMFLLFHMLSRLVKNLTAMQETWVQSLGWDDPLENEMAAHSSLLAWRIPWTEEPGRLQSMGSLESDTT